MPAARFVRAENEGGFVMDFWAESGAHATPPSSDLNIDQHETIDLAKHGFVAGEPCWVSCNIEAGRQNHQSGANFTYAPDGGTAVYKITGGVWDPSWDQITPG
ncbi:MAG TPA: hypothetical protein VGW80_02540 [Solirubrobacterales bacterium]|jgi:hypothetical protein|nr:hypothetical protein [Solirubrobacterales bacterium]